MSTALIPVEQKTVNFNGAELMAVKANDGKIYAGVKWICMGLGLSEGQYQNQTRKLNEDVVLSKGIAKIQLPTAGGPQEVLVIELDFLPLWLAKINANIIEVQAVQDRLIEYQLRAKDVLAAAFVPQAPASLEDLIILQAQSVKELKARVASIEERALAAHHRIDTLDAIDTIGDPKQRLNAMIRKYAHQEGLTFSKAWGDFIQAYNTAFKTNLKLLIGHHMMKTGARKITTPEYLAAVDKLEDGIRVADKLLNQAAVNE